MTLSLFVYSLIALIAVVGVEIGAYVWWTVVDMERIGDQYLRHPSIQMRYYVMARFARWAVAITIVAWFLVMIVLFFNGK